MSIDINRWLSGILSVYYLNKEKIKEEVEMKNLIVFIMFSTVLLLSDVTFTDINAGLPGVKFSSASWGDFDNDGDLDILITGNYSSGYLGIFRNDEGVFLYAMWFPSVEKGSVSLGDYDNDGYLDILMTGSYGSPISKIYRNTGPWTITEINAGLTGVYLSSVAWGDYDNDGDLDILLTGESDGGRISKIYRNDSGIFIEINAGLTAVYGSSVAWGDYDNDGDLDILLTGIGDGGAISKIYRNDSGTFIDINAGLTGVYSGSVAWGDYDNDGDLDILLTGALSIFTRISEIYRNDSGIFTNINAGLTGVSSGSVVWGDYDNDGDLDILLTGALNTYAGISEIYRNDSGIFTNINAGLTGVFSSSVAWGDYDNDGDLDILLTGDSDGGIISKIYRNDSIQKNTPPSRPSNMKAEVVNDRLKLYFDASSDAQTPQLGLSYNIELFVDGQRLKSSMSDITSGYRKLAAIGNSSQNTFWYLADFIPQCERLVSWKVQAIDHCFAGSEFESFPESGFSGRDLEVHSKPEMYGTDFLSWEYAYIEYINNYMIQIDDDPAFGSPIEEVILLEKNADYSKGNNKTLFMTKTLNTLAEYDSLNNNSTYYWRVKPVYGGGIVSRYNTAFLSFVFNPVVYPPSSISISVGNYVTVSWGSGKEEAKGQIYNVYSSDDPYAEFPGGWGYQAAVNGTEWVTTASSIKKFYCVTAASVVK